MSSKGLRKIFLSIILPSILAIILFIVSIYVVIIPTFEKNMMAGKKDMIKELTNTAWSLVKEFDDDYQDSLISLDEAKKLAAAKVRKMRYGKDLKDYFWITDYSPVMIMHPYRDELNGQKLDDYTDPDGKKLFVEASELVQENGDGYFDYKWQWKDDSTKIVEKLSYVKGYKPWQWVIGTGIYLEDVKAEITSLKNRLLRISFIITFVIIIILIYIIRQSLNIENKRRTAEQNLLKSRERYKTLVEASTEGTLMIIDDKIVFSNKKFNELVNCSAHEVLGLSFDDIFSIKWLDVASQFDEPEKSVSFESQLVCSQNKTDVVLSVSKVKYGEQNGFIVIVKDVSSQKQIEKATQDLSQELQTSLMLMNQPIRHFIKPFIKCALDTPINEAAAYMSRKKQNIIFINQDKNIIGVVNDSDLRQRVLATALSPEVSVSQVMTSPIKSIKDNTQLYEAMLIFNSENISHLAVKDNMNIIVGMVSNEDILNLHKNSLSYLVKEIRETEELEQLRKIQERIPVIVKALLDSGAKTQNITRIISSVADAITEKLIELAIEEFGQPPCKFAFIAMGSEGRMEQTLATDQDNAIIIENLEGEELEQAREYFLNMANRINKNLDYVGYNYCKGNIMAKNPDYTQPLDKWKEYFKKWMNDSNPQNVLDATIFFDFRYIYGNENLVFELTEYINQISDKHPVFLYQLANSVINFKAPSNLSQFNVKAVLLPFTGFIKTYSLKNKISETNTLERLERLNQLEIIQKNLYEELLFSYDFLMTLRFRFQVDAIFDREIPGNDIDGSKLTDIEKTTLKKIFSELSTLQTKLGFDFKGGVN